MTTQIIYIPADPAQKEIIEVSRKLLDEYFKAGYLVKGVSGAGNHHCCVLYREGTPTPAQEKPIEQPEAETGAMPPPSSEPPEPSEPDPNPKPQPPVQLPTPAPTQHANPAARPNDAIQHADPPKSHTPMGPDREDNEHKKEK